MKTKGLFLINIYNYLIVKHNNKSVDYHQIENQTSITNEIESEDYYKNMLQADTLQFEANPEIQNILEKRMAQKTAVNSIQKNSFVDIFTSFFTLWNFEFKMGVVGLAFALFISIGNNNEGIVNSNLDSLSNKSFFCDTFPQHSPCLADSTMP